MPSASNRPDSVFPLLDPPSQSDQNARAVPPDWLEVADLVHAASPRPWVGEDSPMLRIPFVGRIVKRAHTNAPTGITA